MSRESECELARLGHPPVADGDAKAVDQARRTVLRAADGVPLEAAYTPWSGGGDAAVSAVPVIVVAHGFTGALDRPALRRAAGAFARHTAVVTFSFRGHGRSGGRSTVGDREVLDLAAAVRWARERGHRSVATVGFSMGGSVALRHAALCEDAAERTDAVVAVSAPARWYYRGTAPMRRLHWVVQRPVGRLVSRWGLRTRVHTEDWDPVPPSPTQVAPKIAPTPLLVVHGDRDAYFPLDHPLGLVRAADPRCTELWVEHGFGHAENAAPDDLLHRIARWATGALAA
ncbi:alpha/beta fold hydrolase [Streptomyces sp. DSM 42041]|uniref:Alpha/beta fold hydrolase n=1 Tax=Streptomyces hazeniae TaxID=3075538 RepID=A0ABU2NNM1_9ACTN|nr:alpha/beta fold hydrolase [Streptomyces sp. DSM 42041]MDT0378568.1 alpha/beta fold hydrolase [Streptomyces sp. DSM 42041]